MDNSSDNTQGNIIDVKKLIYKIASKWFWLVISLFIAFSIAYFINKYTDPVYNTSATILLTDKDNALVSGVENIIEEMDSWFCRPATLMELLALGATHPELQREFRVVALGSIWRDSRGICLVPFLGVHGVMRKSYLNPFDCDWDANFRFLGVRK